MPTKTPTSAVQTRRVKPYKPPGKAGRPILQKNPKYQMAPEGSRGRMLYDIRSLLHISQREIGKRLGRDPESISRFESGKRHVPDVVFFLAVSFLTPAQKAELISTHALQPLPRRGAEEPSIGDIS